MPAHQKERSQFRRTDSRTTRRRFLGGVGAALASGLAGCSDGDSSGSGFGGPSSLQSEVGYEVPDSLAQDVRWTIRDGSDERTVFGINVEYDRRSERWYATVESVSGSGGMTMAETYHVDGTTYVRTFGGTCQSHDGGQGGSQGPVGVGEFAGTADPTHVETTTRDGEEVEVWETQVSGAATGRVQGGSVGGGGGQAGGIPQTVDSGVSRIYVSTSSNYITYAEQEVELADGDGQFLLEVDMYDFDQSFDIQPPENCEGSVDPGQFEDGGQF